MGLDRRRFLQVLAAAPFMPIKEILIEASKPVVLYSLPPIRSFTEIDLVALELEHFAKQIPDLLFNAEAEAQYERAIMRGRFLEARFNWLGRVDRTEFRVPMRVARSNP
jgi:hypothetical protein